MTDQMQHLEPERIRRLLNEVQEPGDSADAAAASAHLAHCGQCRDALRCEMPDVAARVAQMLTPTTGDYACLDEELIACYVNGEADAFDTEMVEMHLEDCVFCARDVVELKAFRQQMEVEPQLLPEPANSQHPESVTLPSVTVPVAVNVHPAEPTGRQVIPSAVTWWQRLRAWLVPVSTRPLFPLLAGAAMATSIIYAALVMPMQARLKGEQEAQKKLLEAQISKRETEIGKQEKQIAALERNGATAKQAQVRVDKLHEELASTQYELAALREQRKQDLLARAASTPDKRPERPTSPDIRRADPEAFPPAFAKYLDHPQLALAEGAGQLADVATDHSQTLGSHQEQTSKIELLAPVACVVATQFPQFRWRPLRRAARYRVDIRVPSTNHDLEPSPPTSTTNRQLTYPLQQGVTYGWLVVSLDKNGNQVDRSPLRRFKVLDAQTARDLKRFVGSPLALSVVYAKAGMPSEAEQELRKYLHEDPNSTRARGLRDQITALQQKAHDAAQ